jgi:uncharacterized protein (TIGR02284 family)
VLTRDSEQILLNELHVLCMEAADHYRAAMAKPCVADMESLFADAASEHQNFAAELAAYIRLNDDQPKLPDPDKETIELFFASIKARLATNERQALIEEQVKVEQKLCETIQAALQSALPVHVKQLLEDMRAKIKSMQQVLREQQ